MVAVALSHRRSFHDPFQLPQDCRRCRGDGGAALRADWGCQKETEDIQLWIPCPCGREPKCSRCHGGGFEGLRRCPQKIAGPEEWELLALHRHWPQALPYAGGIYDQPAPYVAAMRLLDWAEALMQKTIADSEKNGGK